MEQAHGVGAAAHRRHQHVRQPAFLLVQLRLGLGADDRLEVAHHRRVGVRAGHRADDVEGVERVADPVAQRLVQRVLQRARARAHRPDLGTQQLHAEHVGLLPLDVALAHVDDAFQAEARGHGRGRHAVLAGAGLGDDPLLAHPPGQHHLAQHVVDLVRAGVVELVALEVDLGAAEMVGQPLGEIERRRAADIVLEPALQLGVERGIALGVLVGLLELQDQRHQRLGDEAAAMDAEPAMLVRAVAQAVGHRHRRKILIGAAHGREEGFELVRVLDPWPALDTGRHIDDRRLGQRDGCRHVSGMQPAGQQPGALQGDAFEQPPVERQAVPTRESRVPGRLGVEQDHVGGLGIGRQGREVVRRLGAQGLDHPAAEAQRDLGHPLGRLVAVELEQVERDRLQQGLDLGVGGVHHQPDRLGPLRHLGHQLARQGRVDVARRGRIEDEAQEGGTQPARLRHARGLGQPADLDLRGHLRRRAAAAGRSPPPPRPGPGPW